MLKHKRRKDFKSNFKKRINFTKQLMFIQNYKYFPAPIYLTKKKLILKLRKLKRLVKKKWFNCIVVKPEIIINKIKSKNSRMGGGKGQSSKPIIRPTITMLSYYKLSIVKLKKIKQI